MPESLRDASGLRCAPLGPVAARVCAVAGLVLLLTVHPSRASALDSSDAADSSDAGRASPAAAVEAAGADAEPSPPLWTEIYTEGEGNQWQERNTEGFAEAKLGKRIPLAVPVDFYVKTRVYRDTRDFFWNNRADFGLGVRVPLLKKVSLNAFGEVVRGEYFRTGSGAVAMDGLQGRIESTRNAIDAAQKDLQAAYKDVFLLDPGFVAGDTALYRQLWNSLDTAATKSLQSAANINAKLDSLETAKDSLRQVMDSLALIPAGEVWEYRAGLVFWYGWGEPDDESAHASVRLPFRFWGEVYTDCIYSALRRSVRTRSGGETYQDSLVRLDNLVLYSNPAVGLQLMEGRAGEVAGYATVYAWLDTHGDWWTNLAMAGPGLRYKPFPGIDLSFTAEYLWGRYYGRERATDPNPYPASFNGLRVGASLWYGTGI